MPYEIILWAGAVHCVEILPRLNLLLLICGKSSAYLHNSFSENIIYLYPIIGNIIDFSILTAVRSRSKK